LKIREKKVARKNAFNPFFKESGQEDDSPEGEISLESTKIKAADVSKLD
jgi:hypothetical protein